MCANVLLWRCTVSLHSCVLCFFPTAEARGLPCDFSGQVYQHGEDFQPNCQNQCTCIDGVVGCMPLCPQQMSLPDWRCLRPRLVRPEDGCCEEWVCDDDNHISEEPGEMTQPSLHDSQPIPNHISVLLQAQLQPRPPASTRRAMHGGKTSQSIPDARSCGLRMLLMLMCNR